MLRVNRCTRAGPRKLLGQARLGAGYACTHAQMRVHDQSIHADPPCRWVKAYSSFVEKEKEIMKSVSSRGVHVQGVGVCGESLGLHPGA